MQDNRPAVYLEGDNVIYRASALGHPICQLWAARCGLDAKPFPKVIQEAMDEGTELESQILNLLYEKYHWGFSNGQQFQVELVVGAWNGKTLIVRGKMDERRDDGYSVDVKKLKLSSFYDIPDYYHWQQSVYAIGLGKDKYYMPVYNKETDDIEPWSLNAYVPRYTREQIRDRVLEVEEYYHSNQMPPCPGEFGCQYYYLHEGKPDAEELPSLVTQMVQARINLSRKIALLDNARKTLDEAITPKLDLGTTYGLDDWKIQVLEKSRRFNTAAAKSLLTAAEVDWENDPDFWIEGNGTQLRMTPPKKKPDTVDP